MEKGLSVEMLLIGVALFVLCGIALAILISHMYNPPVPPSQQNIACVTNGITLSGHTRAAENARDASRYVQVTFRTRLVSPCFVNYALDLVADNVQSSCYIGKKNNVLLQVNETNCNLVDVAGNKTS